MAVKKKIVAVHWDSIVREIGTGYCVPFLGAGVNASAPGYQGLPMGGEVARRLVGKLLERQVTDFADLVDVTPKPALKNYPDLRRTRAEDLARVALHIQLVGGYPAVVNYLREILQDAELEPAPALRVLARLPFKLIVTTNYDRLLERAFELEDQAKPHVLSQPVKGFTAAAGKEWKAKLSEDRRVVYKLHGSFDDPTNNLVVSEDDYIEFLGIASDEKVGVPNQIKARIQNSVLLFLGYGLEDWDVRSIYKLLVENTSWRDRNMSFAIQKDPPDFWVRFWDRKDVTIYNLDLAEFAGQLEEQYRRRQ